MTEVSPRIDHSIEYSVKHFFKNNIWRFKNRQFFWVIFTLVFSYNLKLIVFNIHVKCLSISMAQCKTWIFLVTYSILSRNKDPLSYYLCNFKHFFIPKFRLNWIAKRFLWKKHSKSRFSHFIFIKQSLTLRIYHNHSWI